MGFPFSSSSRLLGVPVLHGDRRHHDGQEVAEAQRLAPRHGQEVPHIGRVLFAQVQQAQRPVAVAVQAQEGAAEAAALQLRELLDQKPLEGLARRTAPKPFAEKRSHVAHEAPRERPPA